ncbi:hypothetical protein RB595_010472 [Gaeumannomyces hyphopodioides]
MSVHTSGTTTTDVLRDIGSNIHGQIPRFTRKYFDQFNPCLPAASHPSCSTPLSPDSFPEWFSVLSPEDLEGSRGAWHTISATPPRPDTAYLLAHSPSFDPRAEHCWGDVQVVGLVCREASTSYQAGLEIFTHARKVFASQPTRLFFHYFYIHESAAELWAFDRSGLYSSEPLELGNDAAQIASILRSHRLMADNNLGKNDIIKHDDGGDFITLDNGSSLSPTTLYLDEQPISLRQALVGVGTVCYKARSPDSNRWDYVVKFKWRRARDRREDEILLLTEEKHVPNVVSLVCYKGFVSTAELRSGLRWGDYRRLVTHEQPNGEPQNDQVEKHKLGSGIKGIAAATEETDTCLRNRIFTCIVLSPAGRPLHTFKTATELLQVFCDAATAHRFLHTASVLHQNVSMGNVVITDDEASGTSRGILIDFDTAVRLADVSQTPGDIIGTRPFMAIGVLQGMPHTYRHDLEAFLYLFLYAIIANRTDSPPPTSKLRKWAQWERRRLL